MNFSSRRISSVGSNVSSIFTSIPTEKPVTPSRPKMGKHISNVEANVNFIFSSTPSETATTPSRQQPSSYSVKPSTPTQVRTSVILGPSTPVQPLVSQTVSNVNLRPSTPTQVPTTPSTPTGGIKPSTPIFTPVVGPKTPIVPTTPVASVVASVVPTTPVASVVPTTPVASVVPTTPVASVVASVVPTTSMGVKTPTSVKTPRTISSVSMNVSSIFSSIPTEKPVVITPSVVTPSVTTPSVATPVVTTPFIMKSTQHVSNLKANVDRILGVDLCLSEFTPSSQSFSTTEERELLKKQFQPTHVNIPEFYPIATTGSTFGSITSEAVTQPRPSVKPNPKPSEIPGMQNYEQQRLQHLVNRQQQIYTPTLSFPSGSYPTTPGALTPFPVSYPTTPGALTPFPVSYPTTPTPSFLSGSMPLGLTNVSGQKQQVHSFGPVNTKW